MRIERAYFVVADDGRVLSTHDTAAEAKDELRRLAQRERAQQPSP